MDSEDTCLYHRRSVNSTYTALIFEAEALSVKSLIEFVRVYRIQALTLRHS